MEGRILVLLNKINVAFLDLFDDCEVGYLFFPGFEVAIPSIKFSFGDLLPGLIIFFRPELLSERIDFGQQVLVERGVVFVVLGMLDVETANLSDLLFHVDARVDGVNVISLLLSNRLILSWQTWVQRYGSRSTLQPLKILFKVHHTSRDALSLSYYLSHI